MKKGTLLAVVVFALLFGGVVLTTRQKPERGITRLSFSAVDPETVTRVVTTGKHAVEIERHGDRWQLADGKRADAAAARRLLEAIPSLVSADVVTRNPERFAELEVDDDKGTVVRAFAGDREVARFTVGTPVRGGSHVRVDGTVYAVKGVYAGTFARPTTAWLEKQLFRLRAEDVVRLEVRPGGGPPYALVKRDGEWTLEDPSILPAGFRFDRGAARGLVTAAIGARASDVLAADPGVATTGLDDTADVLVIAAGAEQLTLRLGKAREDKAVYARADGWDEVVTLAEHTARSLRKTPTELRDLTLLAFDPPQVSGLELSDGERRLVFARKEGTWTLAQATEEVPQGFTLDPARIEQRVGALRTSRALEVAEGGLDHPRASATVVLGNGERVTLTFGAATGDAVLARGNADDQVYLVSTHTRDGLLRGIDSFRKTAEQPGLANVDPETLERLPPEIRQALEQKIAEERLKQRLVESAP